MPFIESKKNSDKLDMAFSLVDKPTRSKKDQVSPRSSVGMLCYTRRKSEYSFGKVLIQSIMNEIPMLQL